MPLDRHRPSPGEPVFAEFGKPRQPAGHLRGVRNPIGRGGLPSADFHSEIGPVEPHERVFIGDIVAEVDHRSSPDAVPQRVDRLALRGIDHG